MHSFLTWQQRLARRTLSLLTRLLQGNCRIQLDGIGIGFLQPIPSTGYASGYPYPAIGFGPIEHPR